MLKNEDNETPVSQTSTTWMSSVMIAELSASASAVLAQNPANGNSRKLGVHHRTQS
jgi:hypothetical protein